MTLTRDDAWTHLCEWTETESLRKHALAVEAVMREAARKYGGEDADSERWGIAGMLHDADYERWPEEHPRRIVAWISSICSASASAMPLVPGAMWVAPFAAVKSVSAHIVLHCTW